MANYTVTVLVNGKQYDGMQGQIVASSKAQAESSAIATLIDLGVISFVVKGA